MTTKDEGQNTIGWLLVWINVIILLRSHVVEQHNDFTRDEIIIHISFLVIAFLLIKGEPSDRFIAALAKFLPWSKSK